MKKDFLQTLSDERLEKLYQLIGQVNEVLNPDNLTFTTLSSLSMDVALHFELFDLDLFAELTRRERLKK